jgi:predicted transcriptional regulator
MINLPEQGYTPKNYQALVKSTGLSNADFYRTFDIPEQTFYKHRNGTRTMKWREWAGLLDSVQQHFNTGYNDMANFIDRLESNTATVNKVAQNPKSLKVAEVVQSQIKSIVIAVHDNNLFKIAAIDKNGKKLISFTASKDDGALIFWFGEGWKSKVIKIERINDTDELIMIDDIA